MAFFSKSIGIGLEQNAHFQDVMQKLESNWEVSSTTLKYLILK